MQREAAGEFGVKKTCAKLCLNEAFSCHLGNGTGKGESGTDDSRQRRRQTGRQGRAGARASGPAAEVGMRGRKAAC